MGLTVNQFKILNGAATLDAVYVNIRDMIVSKDDHFNLDLNNGNIYTFNFMVYYKLNNDTVKVENISHNTETVSSIDSWSLAYNILKDKLTENGYTFTDN